MCCFADFWVIEIQMRPGAFLDKRRAVAGFLYYEKLGVNLTRRSGFYEACAVHGFVSSLILKFSQGFPSFALHNRCFYGRFHVSSEKHLRLVTMNELYCSNFERMFMAVLRS